MNELRKESEKWAGPATDAELQKLWKAVEGCWFFRVSTSAFATKHLWWVWGHC